MSGADNYFTELFAWALLQFAWQGVFIAVSSNASDRLLRKSSSAFRYRVFCLHLVALVAAPVLTLLISHRAVASTVVTPAVAPSPLFSPFHHLVGSFPWVFGIWLAGILTGACLIAGGRARLHRTLGRLGVPAAAASVIDELAGQMGVRRRLTVLAGEAISPYVVGRYVILPKGIEQQLSTSELRAVLAHEVAHVKRLDYGMNLTQTTLLLLAWPHPAAWMLWAKLRREREACCDEIAARLCGSAVPLARALYRLASKTSAFELALPVSAGSLEFRLERLLSGRQRACRALDIAAPGLALTAFVLVTTLLAPILRADVAARIALVASPLSPRIHIRAHDPAGPFFVDLHRGRVLSISIGDEPIPSSRVVQQGSSVRVLDRAGQELLALRVDPRGGIAWPPRHPRVQ